MTGTLLTRTLLQPLTLQSKERCCSPNQIVFLCCALWQCSHSWLLVSYNVTVITKITKPELKPVSLWRELSVHRSS